MNCIKLNILSFLKNKIIICMYVWKESNMNSDGLLYIYVKTRNRNQPLILIFRSLRFCENR